MNIAKNADQGLLVKEFFGGQKGNTI